MAQLQLQYDLLGTEPIKNKALNILFVFQVNCPGCFAYGIPVVNRLIKEFGKEEIGFTGLSTAFEDFTLNTAEHTQLLLKEQKPVGETKKMLAQDGFDHYPESINFPVVMDRLLTPNDNSVAEVIDLMCAANPGFASWPVSQQNLLRGRIREYLASLEKVAYTFTTNHFRGTPTFVVYNSDMEILQQWFGHVAYEQLAKSLKNLIPQS